jgi:hypothetical protein
MNGLVVFMGWGLGSASLFCLGVGIFRVKGKGASFERHYYVLSIVSFIFSGERLN